MRSSQARLVPLRQISSVKHNMKKNFNRSKIQTLPHLSRIDRRRNSISAYVNVSIPIRHLRPVSIRHRQSESLGSWRQTNIRHQRSCRQTSHRNLKLCNPFGHKCIHCTLNTLEQFALFQDSLRLQRPALSTRTIR